MIRQNIILGDYKYILELYKDGIDLEARYKKDFYMIRNLSILLESVTNDKDIYFIESSNEDIVYPITSTKNIAYSINPSDFSSDLNENTKEVLECGFYSDKLEKISLPCDILRIYLPTIKADLKAILDVKNTINGINFHYLIKDINTRINNSEIKSGNEFEYDHQFFSQYIDVFIPSINYLISNPIYIKEYNLTNFDYIEGDDNQEYISFSTLFKKYSIDKNSDGVYFKNYIDEDIISEIYNVLNVSLYPYTDIDDNGIFIPDPDLNLNTEVFNEDLRFTLSSELRFPRLDDVIDKNELDTSYLLRKKSYEKYSMMHKEDDEYDENYEIYSKRFLSFEILSPGTITYVVENVDSLSTLPIIYYKINTGSWECFVDGMSTGNYSFNYHINTIEVNTGDIVQFKSDNVNSGDEFGTKYIYTTYTKFHVTSTFNVYGNMLSLIWGDSFPNEPELSTGQDHKVGNFQMLFSECDTLISAQNLILDNRKRYQYTYKKWIKDDAYKSLFEPEIGFDSNLEIAPTLYGSITRYPRLFNSCSKINRVVNFDKYPTDIKYEDWLFGTSENGTLIIQHKSDINTYRTLIPSTWNIEYIDGEPESEEDIPTEEEVIIEIDENENIFKNHQKELLDYKSIEGIPCIISKFNYKNINGKSSILENYLLYSNTSVYDYTDFDPENISEEYELEENIKTTGFLVEIASDSKFKNIIYKYSVLIPKEEIIDTLIFPVNSIFNSWDNYPDILIVRIRFIDKVAAQIIESNPVIITKEWFKYLVNDSGKRKLSFRKVYYFNESENMVKQLNLDSVNFIDKINCTIVKNTESNGLNVSKASSPKIIYKPIFYKVVDLQDLSIVSNIKQNIGINLSEYLGKVETFKLVLDGTEYVESGRNDIYVIFTIAASKLSVTNGKYYILNENSELISSGNYKVE